MRLYLVIMLLAFVQNVSFSIVSRSRNRNNMKYHLIASVFSNGIWFLTFRALVTSQMNLLLFPFYTAGTVAGSLCGAWISMRIESWLGAASDDHIKRDRVAELEARLRGLEEKMQAPAVDVVAAVVQDIQRNGPILRSMAVHGARRPQGGQLATGVPAPGDRRLWAC